uniref:Pinopsin-like n=1 Tax=Crocodylus porosus TaxID=8502 RepID=A0A7M4F0U3_CROPO
GCFDTKHLNGLLTFPPPWPVPHRWHPDWYCSPSVNGLVIMVSVRYKKLRTPLHYIPVNLVVANLLVTLFGSTVSFSSNINGFFMLGKKLCEFEGFLVSLTGIVGLWSLAILAFERYIMICKPTGDFRFQQKHALMGCAFTWIWSLLWRVPPILGWSSYIPEGLRTSCGPNWYAGGSNNNSYITALFVTCFVLPLSMIRFSYTNLLAIVSQAPDQEGRARQPANGVTQMVIAMVLASLTSWLPYTTFAMVVATNKDIPIQPALASLPSYFSKTATVYNPVIYVFMNKQRDNHTFCLSPILSHSMWMQRTTADQNLSLASFFEIAYQNVQKAYRRPGKYISCPVSCTNAAERRS